MAELSVFAKRMREAREKKGIKQKDLAELIKVTPQTISAYEKTGKAPTLDNAILIARALDVSLDWLVAAKDNQAQKAKNLTDYVFDMFEAIDHLGLEFCEDTDWNEDPTGKYIIRLENELLRGFDALVSDLHKLKEVRSVLEPDDYKTLVHKKIKSRAAESNNFEFNLQEFPEITDDDDGDGEPPF